MQLFFLDDGTYVRHSRTNRPGGPLCTGPSVAGCMKIWVSVGGGTYYRTWVMRNYLTEYKDLTWQDFSRYVLHKQAPDLYLRRIDGKRVVAC